jgi:hypothetical protein
MNRQSSERTQKRLRGVTELAEVLGERRYRAWIGRGHGRLINLGVYASPWLAAFAHNVAAELLHGRRIPGNEIPESSQPKPQEVSRIRARVQRRLGLEPPRRPEGRPPSDEAVRTLFEVAVVGFWRQEVASHGSDSGRALDIAARRLVDAAHVLFWSREAGSPTALEVMEALLALRLDRTFRRGSIARAVLDDDGDDETRLARWLVYPDDLPGGLGFREAIERLYADVASDASGSAANATPSWAVVLEIEPPFNAERIRAAYRSRSKAVHPDTGGSQEEFLQLQMAYENALKYLRTR